MTSVPAWQALLDWWFGDALSASEVAAQRHGLWFGKSACEDMASDLRFGSPTRQALDGGLADWAGSAQGWLALILLLDQLPRNLFRSGRRAYEGDPAARRVADQSVARGFDRSVPPDRRLFFYLPFQHSEDGLDQRRSVRLIGALARDLPPARAGSIGRSATKR